MSHPGWFNAGRILTAAPSGFRAEPAVPLHLASPGDDIIRSASTDAFAGYNGTAPIDVASGDQIRHRSPAPEGGIDELAAGGGEPARVTPAASAAAVLQGEDGKARPRWLGHGSVATSSISKPSVLAR